MAVRAVPQSVMFGTVVQKDSYVKTPHEDAVLYSEKALPEEMLTRILFEEIGGVELISISRQDIINGVEVNYSLVGNLSNLQSMFNSNNIISGFESRDTHTNQYPIDIGQRIDTVEFNDQGDLIVDFNEIGSDESVEVMILASGTLYEV